MKIVDAIWRLFVSLKLTALLLALLMGGAFVGMFIDQTAGQEQHLAALEGRELASWLFTACELYDVFGSWWFVLLTLSLSLNLIACTLERLPRLWRDVFRGARDLDDEHLTALGHCARLHGASYDRAAAACRAVLQATAGRVTAFQRADSLLLFAQRQRSARFASVVVHLSLLIILFGHTGDQALGEDGTLAIPEGEASRTMFQRGPAGLTRRRQLDFTVRCDDFRYQTFAGGRPKDYESDLVVLDGEREVASKTIRVNDPLDYRGYKLYQSSYQRIPGEEQVHLLAGARGSELREHRLAIGERVEVAPATSVVPIEVVEQLGDLGQALRLQLVKPDGSVETLTLLQRLPELDARMRQGELEFRYLGAEPRFATVLSVGRSPLAGLVFAGFALLMLGTAIALLLSHCRYWIRVRRLDDGQAEILVAGSAKRHQPAFAGQFGALVRRLEAACGDPGAGAARGDR
ncbi:MAG: cytochrome c biogenesis protein ResB [Deltaproteobacteria bacterium]|nr:cytochrome c biogenesis protein ResB [Deltaproteobacteria bacterium]